MSFGSSEEINQRIAYSQIFNDPNPQNESYLPTLPSFILYWILEFLDPKPAGCFLLQICKLSLYSLNKNTLIKPYINHLKNPYQVKHIVVGNGYTLALTQSGQVYAWGYNGEGQLGLGDYAHRTRPTLMTLPDGMDPIQHIVAGSGHTLALTQSGQLYAWGYNGEGQLGLGDYAHRTRPTLMTLPDGMNPIQHLALGCNNTLALTQSGQVYAWGRNDYGQLGLADRNNRTRPTLMTLPDGMDPIQHIVAGFRHTLALTQSGQVYAWGWNKYGQLGLGDEEDRTRPTLMTLPEGMDPIQHIVAGEYFTLALTQSGQVYAWGGNNRGQLGLGDSGFINNRNRPTLLTFPAGMDPIQHIVAGRSYTLALTQSGQVYAWGANYFGELGLGDESDRNKPTLMTLPEGMDTIQHIVAGSGHTLALTQSGQVYTWGLNNHGQLGLGDSGAKWDDDSTNRTRPTRLSMIPVYIQKLIDALNDMQGPSSQSNDRGGESKQEALQSMPFASSQLKSSSSGCCLVQ